MEYLCESSRKQPRTRSILHLLTLGVAFCNTTCSAYDMMHTDVSNTSYYKDLIKNNILVVDTLHSHGLGKRESSTNGTGSSSSTTVLNTDTGLPLPFDTSLGSNFTDTGCPSYFAQFLSDSTFLSCLPVSLLLQNSMSFFQAARSPSLLTKTLDTSCAASLAVCSPLMSKIANELILQGNCQDDYSRQNPLVLQAYSGLRAYEPVYQATCEKDKSTDKYFFTEAMESDNADDTYPYYTAVGLALPTGSRPTCSDGLKRTMEIFAGYAVQDNQPLSQTYLGCATMIDSVCGEGFASTQVKAASKVAVNKSSRLLGNVALTLASLSLTIFMSV